MEYYESQRFRQWWLWLIIIISISLPLVLALIEFVLKQPISGGSSSLRDVLIISVITVVALLLFAAIKLETKIDAKGIHYRFFPFHLSYQTILWEEVEEVFVRAYHPIKEYGGWGIRFGVFNKCGMAYNISGNKGIQLQLKNGKKILIGTQKPSEVQHILHRIHHKPTSHIEKTFN